MLKTKIGRLLVFGMNATASWGGTSFVCVCAKRVYVCNKEPNSALSVFTLQKNLGICTV